MNKVFRYVITICLLVCSTIVFAQSAKTKTTKPATPVAKKIDYPKLKQEIKELYRDEKHAAVIAKATQYLLKFPKDTGVMMQKAVSQVSLKQYQTGFTTVKQFFINADTAAKYIAFMSFSVPATDIQTIGVMCAEEAIKISPNNPYGYFAKAGLYSDKGEHEKALPIMEQMFALSVNDKEKSLFGHFYPKELAFNKQYEKALQLIDELNKKYPKENEIMYTYSSIYRLKEDYGKAIEKYNEMAALDPTNYEYITLKISALDAWGKNTEACSEIETLIAKDNGYEFMRFRYKCPAYFAKPAANFKIATWAVNANGADYDFTVSNPKGSVDTDLEFDWAMTNADNYKGHIKLTAAAMEKAIAQNNYFGPSLKDATLTDKTTVWISKNVFDDLVKKGSAKMDVGNGEEVFTVIKDITNERDEEIFETKVLVSGEEKYVSSLHVKNEDGGRQLWILNDAKNPLIVKMDIGFMITLKSIE